MSATRKVIGLKRGPYKTVVSDRGREVLRWLNEFGWELVYLGKYWHHWRESLFSDGELIDTDIKVADTTLRALHKRGLISFTPHNAQTMVTITEDGRDYVRRTQ